MGLQQTITPPRVAILCGAGLRIVLFLLLLHGLIFLIISGLPDAATRILGPWVANQAALEERRSQLGPPRAYVADLKAIFRGDFGKSVTGEPVVTIFQRRLIRTAPITIAAVILAGALIFSTLVCLPVCGRHQEHFIALFLRAVTLTPPFFLTLALVATADAAVGGIHSKWGQSLLMASCAAIPAAASLNAALLPVLGLLVTGPIATCYRAKGLSEWELRFRFLKNLAQSGAPLLPNTVLSVVLSTLAAELVLDWPGFGRLFAEALRAGDKDLLRAWLLLTGAIVLVLSLVWPVKPSSLSDTAF